MRAVKPKRSTASHAKAWQATWGPPRRRGPVGGVALLGVLVGGAVGALITDASTWTDLRYTLGLQRPIYGVLQGRPSRVADGDTFRFGKSRIRLLGVDAPEMSTPDGPRARTHLTALISDSKGGLRCEDTGQRSFERVVARCFTADGRDLGRAMVESGWATAMPRFSGGAYVPAQARAMWNRRGMWGD